MPASERLAVGQLTIEELFPGADHPHNVPKHLTEPDIEKCLADPRVRYAALGYFVAQTTLEGANKDLPTKDGQPLIKAYWTGLGSDERAAIMAAIKTADIDDMSHQMPVAARPSIEKFLRSQKLIKDDQEIFIIGVSADLIVMKVEAESY